ncbi:hypothetical protein Vqi01_02210 [Micromonospora qiuiae]|uniref:Uncharacterized protein n=1 Tax=Micromonospora qiuiae TaxID=502268 RepID=A0ABQ4J4H2_9ACTN|nr:hypothetical protein [Micromonospora qiuiae]GIJ25059.1 hypothetical protein Vqi01_02210 [Micromonospora qiuiae]
MVKSTHFADVLRFRPREEYLRMPMPSERDERITGLVEALRDRLAVEAAARSLAAMEETVLSPYVQRAAALAVRLDAPRYLRAGIRAAVLMAANEDARDVVIVLALLWRSAELLKLEPGAEFNAVASVFGRYGEPLIAFAARPADGRTLSAMGYVEVGEGSQFRYECRW